MNSAKRQVHGVQNQLDVAMKTAFNPSICHYPAAIHGDFVPIRSITSFEDLSNEILFDIFEFLDGYDILEAFSNLNIRFEDLFRCSYFSLKLNIPFMSKSNFKKRSTNIIAPHIQQIISLNLSEAFFIKYFVTSFPIDLSFIRLESLTLDALDPDSAISVLTSLASLPRLFSLTITFNNYPNEEGDIFQLIFRLPVLTFAKLWFEDSSGNTIPSFPVATSIYQQSSTLEHLVIDNLCSPAHIYTLLSYTPRLRRLSTHWLSFNVKLPTEQLIIPLNLTHLSLNRCHLSFDDLESFITIIGSQLEVFRISMDNNMTSLNAYRWQQLVLRYMPHLRTFVFDYFGPMIKDANGNIACRTLIDQFSSPFWIERQWFFGHRHDQFSDLHPSFIAFYSTQSYWRHSCRINVFLHNHLCSYQDMVFHLAFTRCVHMESEHVVADAPFQFPHATQLILTGNYNMNIRSFIDNLSRIFCLKNITHLEVSRNNQCLDILTILGHMPNVHTFVIEAMLLSEIHLLLDKQINNVDLVYNNNNNVTDLQIKHALTLDAARLLNNIFPRMECLNIRCTNENLISIVRILLLNRINNSRLFSLIVNDENETIEQLKTMIDCEKLLDDYQIERIPVGLYFWW